MSDNCVHTLADMQVIFAAHEDLCPVCLQASLAVHRAELKRVREDFDAARAEVARLREALHRIAKSRG